MAELGSNAVACNEITFARCRVLPPGEFNDMITVSYKAYKCVTSFTQTLHVTFLIQSPADLYKTWRTDDNDKVMNPQHF